MNKNSDIIENEMFDYSKQPGLFPDFEPHIGSFAPQISIITAYYEAWEHFRQTYQSVLNQTFPLWEWIIVNDGSNSHKEDLIQLIRDDPRIRIIEQENRGPAAARNRALQHVQSELVVPLDADDLLENTFLECAFCTMQTHLKAGWAYSDTVGFGLNNYLWTLPFSSDMMKVKNDLVLTACIRKKALDMVNGYHETIKFGYEDWQLWLDLLSKGFYPVHMKWYGFWYRRSDKGVLSRARMNAKPAMREIRKAASGISKKIEPIEFPRISDKPTNAPHRWDWNIENAAYPSRDVVVVMADFLFPGITEPLLRVIEELRKDGKRITVITTHPVTASLRQKVMSYSHEIFVLSAFLETEDWASFVLYYMQTRQVENLLLADCPWAYYLLPWLQINLNNFETIAVLYDEDQAENKHLISTMHSLLDHVVKLGTEFPCFPIDSISASNKTKEISQTTLASELGRLYQEYLSIKMIPTISASHNQYYVQLLKRIIDTPVIRFLVRIKNKIRSSFDKI